MSVEGWGAISQDEAFRWRLLLSLKERLRFLKGEDDIKGELSLSCRGGSKCRPLEEESSSFCALQKKIVHGGVVARGTTIVPYTGKLVQYVGPLWDSGYTGFLQK